MPLDLEGRTLRHPHLGQITCTVRLYSASHPSYIHIAACPKPDIPQYVNSGYEAERDKPKTRQSDGKRFRRCDGSLVLNGTVAHQDTSRWRCSEVARELYATDS